MSEKVRRVIKCPNCFERIFQIGEKEPPGQDNRTWTQQKFFDHACPGEAEELVWKWLPAMNNITSARAAKKEAAKARRAKFREQQSERKKQATEANFSSAQAGFLNRNYHSHHDVVRMNQNTAKPSNTAESQTSGQSKVAETKPITTIQTMNNPMFSSPPNEAHKRTVDDCPELSIPGSEERAAAFAAMVSRSCSLIAGSGVGADAVGAGST